jgi:hypothetical protein
MKIIYSIIFIVILIIFMKNKSTKNKNKNKIEKYTVDVPMDEIKKDLELTFNNEMKNISDEKQQKKLMDKAIVFGMLFKIPYPKNKDQTDNTKYHRYIIEYFRNSTLNDNYVYDIPIVF